MHKKRQYQRENAAKKGQPPAADRGLLGKREAAWKRRQTQPGKRKKKKAVVSCVGYAADEDTLKV